MNLNEILRGHDFGDALDTLWPASADTHPEGENATKIAVEFMGGAVPHEDAGDAQGPSRD